MSMLHQVIREFKFTNKKGKMIINTTTDIGFPPKNDTTKVVHINDQIQKPVNDGVMVLRTIYANEGRIYHVWHCPAKNAEEAKTLVEGCYNNGTV